MSWNRNSIKPRHVAAAALLLTASAAAADILVVRSMGPSAKSFPPGKRLPETGRITLKASDQLVVLDGRGTRTLRGPGSFALNAPPQRTGGTASAARPDRRSGVAAVRGPERPSLWDVDIAMSSSFCLAEPNNVTLWREETSEALTLTITRTKDNRSERLSWPAGEAKLDWPAALAISNGTDFRLAWAGAPAPTAIRFKTLPQRPAGLEDMASLLITNGCTAQLDLLIETVKVPEEREP